MIRATEGSTWSSRASAAGSGTCGVVIRTDRALRGAERLLGHDRHDLGAPAAQPRVLLDREQPARLRDLREDRARCRAARGVRTSTTLQRDAVLGRADARRPRPPAGPSRPARRSWRRCPRRITFACPSGSTMLGRSGDLALGRDTATSARRTAPDRVADRGGEQTYHVVRVGRGDHLEARHGHRPVLHGLRVLRAEPEPGRRWRCGSPAGTKPGRPVM